MANPRRALTVPDEVHARLLRLARLHDKPASWLIDRLGSLERIEAKEHRFGGKDQQPINAASR
jgi:hypothetical protein